MKTSTTSTDQGFAWVILCASFLNNMLMSGTIRTFGILYAELLDVYGRGAGNTAFMGSLLLFMMAIVGPISGLVSVHYSYKWCTVVGGLFTGAGMALSSLTTNIEMMFITYSLLIGIGIGLSSSPTITIVNFYFEKRRAFANGFLTASMGLASLVYPVLYRKLIDEFGIHGAMLILGGILFNICVGGSFFRQPACFVSANKRSHDGQVKLIPTEDKSSETSCCFNIRNKVSQMGKTYLTLLKNRSFVLYCVALSCALIGYSSNFNILPAHIESQHFRKEDAVITITVIGGTEFVTRFFSGYILDLNHFTVQTMFIVTMFIGGLFSIAFTFFRSEEINIVYGVTVGLFPGVLHSLSSLLMVSILGLQILPSALPFSSFFTCSSCLIGHPFLGWLEDWTGNWKASFYTMGCLFITSSICVFLERHLWKGKSEVDGEMEINVDNHSIKNNEDEVEEELGETVSMMKKNNISI